MYITSGKKQQKYQGKVNGDSVCTDTLTAVEPEQLTADQNGNKIISSNGLEDEFLKKLLSDI